MSGINAEYINPFISSSTAILKQMANIECNLGKPYVRQSPYTGGDIAIFIGITGQIKGQVIFSMNEKEACYIASNMMGGMEVPELDEISKSAISEITNMILGNSATSLAAKGISVDITPPTFLKGQKMQISCQKMMTICVPIEFAEGGKMEIDISMS